MESVSHPIVYLTPQVPYQWSLPLDYLYFEVSAIEIEVADQSDAPELFSLDIDSQAIMFDGSS